MFRNAWNFTWWYFRLRVTMLVKTKTRFFIRIVFFLPRLNFSTKISLKYSYPLIYGVMYPAFHFLIRIFPVTERKFCKAKIKSTRVTSNPTDPLKMFHFYRLKTFYFASVSKIKLSTGLPSHGILNQISVAAYWRDKSIIAEIIINTRLTRKAVYL